MGVAQQQKDPLERDFAMFKPLVVGCLALWLGAAPTAAAEDFLTWRHDFAARAQQAGISQTTLDAALNTLDQPNERIIALDQKQPEKKVLFSEYIDRVVSQERVGTGTARLRDYPDLLKSVSKKYGVPPEIMVALWGVETHYGVITGGFPVVESLATLAFEGRRRDFFETELLAALKILDQGHIDLDAFIGSWAGAMGQCQFMPTSFENYAVDGDGDGHRDIWTNPKDIFPSIANYLKEHGWKAGQNWGRPVQLPEGIDISEEALKAPKTLDEWRKLGVQTHTGNPLPGGGKIMASLWVMNDNPAQAFLVYDNAQVLMKWNRSRYFVLSVGLLADAI
jgi:membrane-bound lytic murein transglycosylase B